MFIYRKENIMQKKRILTIKQASQLIDGITEYRIRQMCVSGQLPCFKAGKKYLISEEALYNTVFNTNTNNNTNAANNN